MNAELLNAVKINLRENSAVFDDAEISPLINAAILDLQRVKVKVFLNEEQELDDLVRQAIMFYAKGYFGYDDNSTKFITAYEDLRDTLSMTKKYRMEE